jgi:NAD(P)-dependent dehydrogenase (short-subunit alcohol dehydrogenase family)
VKELKMLGLENLRAIQCDITSESEVAETHAECVRLLRKRTGGGLHVLVNNAGIIRGGPFDLDDPVEIERQFAVNVFGTMRMCRRFFPQLIAARPPFSKKQTFFFGGKQRHTPRYINVSSVAGRVGVPFTSAYCSTKFAVEGYSDALRAELASYSLSLILIEPGIANTSLWDFVFSNASLNAAWQRASPWQRGWYGRRFLLRCRESAEALVKLGGSPPQRVVSTLHRASLSLSPFRRYSVGPDAKLFWLPLSYSLSLFTMSSTRKRDLPSSY